MVGRSSSPSRRSLVRLPLFLATHHYSVFSPPTTAPKSKLLRLIREASLEFSWWCVVSAATYAFVHPLSRHLGASVSQAFVSIRVVLGHLMTTLLAAASLSLGPHGGIPLASSLFFFFFFLERSDVTAQASDGTIIATGIYI